MSENLKKLNKISGMKIALKINCGCNFSKNPRVLCNFHTSKGDPHFKSKCQRCGDYFPRRTLGRHIRKCIN